MERLRPIACDQRWAIALAWAVPISLFLLALVYYWFGVADRYAIFLYGHTSVGIPPPSRSTN